MLNVTLRGLWAHKLRFLLTGLAVVLGVAFVSGTMILTDTMGRTFDNLLAENNEGIDAIVQRQSQIEGAVEEVRERLDASTLDAVLAVEGVDQASGSVQGFAQLVRADGEVVEHTLGATIGTNWIDDPRLNPFQLADGAPPTAAGEAVLDRATMNDEHLAVGDSFTVLGKTGPVELTLVGAATFGGVDGVPGSTMIATDMATAQSMFGERDRHDAIVVAASSGVSADDLAVRIQTSLADRDVEVVTGEADTTSKQAELRDNLKFFNTFLMAFAYISLFVGMFIIYNTFSIILAQRTRDLAMLRSIGASRMQVLRSVLIEAVAVAIVSVAIGLVLGIGMSFGLRSLLAGVGLDIPSGPIVLTATTVLTATVLGVLVTLASAVAPALRASRVAPMAALRDADHDRSHRSSIRMVAGPVVMLIGIIATAAGVSGDGQDALAILGLGAAVTMLGVFVSGPLLARPLVRILGYPAVVMSRVVGHLARENARRNPKRTSATAAALTIGVALVGFITIVASSSSAAVAAQVDHSFRADYVIDSGQWGEGGMSPRLAGELEALPEVDSLSPVRVVPVAIAGGSTQLAGLDTAVFDDLYDVEPVAGSLRGMTAGTIAVEAEEAAERHLTIGDSITVTFARTGDVHLAVSAIFDEKIIGVASTAWIVGLDTYEANVTDQYDRQLFIAAAPGFDASATRAAIDEVLVDWPNGELQDQAQFKQTLISEINSLLNLIYGLLFLAVVIALIGIANTLALSVHERTRELGLLRAVGMSRPQTRTLVRWEAVIIAVLGTFLGLALALSGAWAIVRALDGEGIENVVVPTARMVTIVGIAVSAGVAAAAGPARRAARLDVLRAIATS